MSDLKRQLEALRLEEEAGRPRRWRLRVLMALALLIAAGAGLWRSRDAWAAIEVETVRPALQAADGIAAQAPLLAGAGYLVARRSAVVSAKIQGRLEELRVEEGTRVNEGELIARLESRDYRAQIARATANVATVQSQIVGADAAIARAEADLAEARRQFELLDHLVEARVVSIDERDGAASRVTIAEAALSQAWAQRGQVLAGLNAAEADVRLQEALYENTVIRAPFTGTVVRKMAEVGESVAPIPPGINLSTASGAIVAIADLDTLEVEVDVAESNVGRLRPDQPAQVTVEAFPERSYRGVLRQVIPTADRTKATVQVKVTILDKDEGLKPEMSARVTFLEFPHPATAQAAADQVMLLPQEAVVTREGRTQVFEVVAEKAHARLVQLGPALRDQAAIAGGLSGDEVVILAPPIELQDGDAVRVRR